MKGKVIAVAGASGDTGRYWYRIFKDIQAFGYTAYCVNPKFKDLDGQPIYPNLTAIGKKIDILVLVVAPDLTLQLVQEAVALKIPEVWFQPGTFKEESAKLAADNAIDVHESCFMVENAIW